MPARRSGIGINPGVLAREVMVAPASIASARAAIAEPNNRNAAMMMRFMMISWSEIQRRWRMSLSPNRIPLRRDMRRRAEALLHATGAPVRHRSITNWEGMVLNPRANRTLFLRIKRASAP
jgi:hypothetical protein